VVTGAVIVTTPSTVAIEDSVKAVRMFEKLQVPVLGVIENMSWFLCGNCATRHEVFSSGDARTRALALGLPFLGSLPLESDVRKGGDQGAPVVASLPASETAASFRAIAGAVAQRISITTLGSGVGASA
jgi:ATP-binding protein involved in chromosome partitioning